MHRAALHRIDTQNQAAIVKQQLVSRDHIFWQAGIGNADGLFGSRFGLQLCIQDEAVPFAQLHGATAKTLDADLGALQIDQHPYPPLMGLRPLTHRSDAAAMISNIPMRQIYAYHIHAGRE
jgi:hypothetical protein